MTCRCRRNCSLSSEAPQPAHPAGRRVFEYVSAHHLEGGWALSDRQVPGASRRGSPTGAHVGKSLGGREARPLLTAQPRRTSPSTIAC